MSNKRWLGLFGGRRPESPPPRAQATTIDAVLLTIDEEVRFLSIPVPAVPADMRAPQEVENRAERSIAEQGWHHKKRWRVGFSSPHGMHRAAYLLGRSDYTFPSRSFTPPGYWDTRLGPSSGPIPPKNRLANRLFRQAAFGDSPPWEGSSDFVGGLLVVGSEIPIEHGPGWRSLFLHESLDPMILEFFSFVRDSHFLGDSLQAPTGWTVSHY